MFQIHCIYLLVFTLTSDGVTSIPCNLEPIIQWLKKSELDSLKDIVKDVTNRFNGGTIRKHSLKMMQTDDRQTNDGEKNYY